MAARESTGTHLSEAADSGMQFTEEALVHLVVLDGSGHLLTAFRCVQGRDCGCTGGGRQLQEGTEDRGCPQNPGQGSPEARACPARAQARLEEPRQSTGCQASRCQVPTQEGCRKDSCQGSCKAGRCQNQGCAEEACPQGSQQAQSPPGNLQGELLCCCTALKSIGQEATQSAPRSSSWACAAALIRQGPCCFRGAARRQGCIPESTLSLMCMRHCLF